MARNNFWVIRVGTQRGVYRSRAEANEHGYRHYNERGWADAFETEGEANEYLAQPVVSRVFVGSFAERFKRQNPILKLLIGGLVLQFFFFVLFKLSFNLDKQICGGKSRLDFLPRTCEVSGGGDDADARHHPFRVV